MIDPSSYKTPTKRAEQTARSTSPFQKYHKKCMCEICNCNHHHCPKEPIRTAKVVPNSHKDYDFPKDYTPSKSFKDQRSYTPTKADPSHFETTNRKEFGWKNLEHTPDRLERLKRGHPPATSSIPFSSSSEYNQTISKPKDVLYYSAYRPSRRLVPSQPFQGKTLYQENFAWKESERVKGIRGMDNLKVGGDWLGQSSYKMEFRGGGEGGRKIGDLNKEDHLRNGNWKLDDKTRYRDDYKKFGPEAYAKNGCPMTVIQPTPPVYKKEGREHIIYDDLEGKWE